MPPKAATGACAPGFARPSSGPGEVPQRWSLLPRQRRFHWYPGDAVQANHPSPGQSQLGPEPNGFAKTWQATDQMPGHPKLRPADGWSYPGSWYRRLGPDQCRQLRVAWRVPERDVALRGPQTLRGPAGRNPWPREGGVPASARAGSACWAPGWIPHICTDLRLPQSRAAVRDKPGR